MASGVRATFEAPRVPPLLMGFRHWGTEILFDHESRPHVNMAPGEAVESLLWQVANDPLDLSSVWTVAKLKADSFEAATDHFMGAAYLPVVRRQLDTQSPA